MKIIKKTINKKVDEFSYPEERYYIADDNDKIIDDAQGYGYKTKEKACKALWFKFKGGREVLNQRETKARKFYKENKKAIKELSDLFLMNIKEIFRGETTYEDMVLEIENKYLIVIDRKIINDLLNIEGRE